MDKKIIAKAVLTDPDGNVLLLKRHPRSKRRPGEWDFPGGKHDAGEGISEAAIREIQEETGLKFEPGELQLVMVQSEPETHGPDLCHLTFVGKTQSREVLLSEEHDEYIWLPLGRALKEQSYPRQKQVLEYIQKHHLLA